MTNFDDPDNRKLLSLLCHGSCLFSVLIVSVGVPIAILFATRDSVVKANAREALNFQINLFIESFVALLLIFLLIGFLLFPIIALFSIIFPILAMVKIIEDPDQPYRYPLTWRIV